MKISIKAFNRTKFFEIAVDEETGVCLVGIPFNYGPAEHSKYYEISREEFALGLLDPEALNHLVEDQNFNGPGFIYYSTFITPM
jgi:hypothetical protein